jgi:hypothetical protein
MRPPAFRDLRTDQRMVVFQMSSSLSEEVQALCRLLEIHSRERQEVPLTRQPRVFRMVRSERQQLARSGGLGAQLSSTQS